MDMLLNKASQLIPLLPKPLTKCGLILTLTNPYG
jgi:hypothetical protein